MLSCTPRRWLLLACVITAMFTVGNTFELCDKFDIIGYETKEKCTQAAINLGDTWQNAVKASKNMLGIVSNKISDKLGSIFAKIFSMNIGLGNKKQKPSQQKSTSSKTKKVISLRDINEEPGFNLTKEEIEKFKMWEKGVIPYFIDEYSFDKVLRDRIRFILDEVNAATNLQFMEIPQPPDDDSTRYIFFINRRGVLKCVDYTSDDFTNEGLQRVILGYDCINLNTQLATVILTVVGVPPQHNAPNRDEYIEIVEEAIIPEKRSLFTVLKNEDWLFHDIEYDFESASHYHYHKYSATGHSTIVPKTQVVEPALVGEDKTFSNSDLLKIKMLYNYISKGPNDKRLAECSQMFQPGKDFHKFKPSKNNLKPRDKPAKYTNNKDSQDLLNESMEDQNSDNSVVNRNYVNPDNDEFGDTEVQNAYVGTGSGKGHKGKVKPEKLLGSKRPLSAESQKRLKLKQLIQDASDYHTEERK